MRILLLGRYNPSEVLAGPEKFAKRLYHNLLAQKIECEFVEYFFDGKKYSLSKKLFGNDTLILNSVKIFRLGLVPFFLFLVKRKPQIIHLVTYERFEFIAYLYSFFARTQILFSVHGFVNYENHSLVSRKVVSTLKIKDKLFEYIFMIKSDQIHIPSDQYKKKLLELYKLNETKVIVIPNGVDEDFFVSKLNNIKTHNKMKTVFIGDEYRQEKGLEFLLKNIENINEYSEVYLLGDVFTSKNNYKDLHIVPKMSKSDMKNLFIQMDIILSCSYYDLFSISVLEGAAIGLFPVLTRETGISELFLKLNIGEVFDYSDSESFVNIFQKLFFNRSLLEKHIQNKDVLQKYSWKNISISFQDLYYQMLISQ
ncbi:MAG: glycosyltransferase family 4 protein [Melioribacteraceae bacterium]|nr:MAG: glycosyltransferase family 4 protein [Melioribacteraceae bacterium]